MVIVIEGELDDQVGDDRGALTSGGMLWFPRRVPHAVANLSQEPCRCIRRDPQRYRVLLPRSA
ncbi:MAG: cupin domain-containing protein [Actinobacteria bacterium]|nr:cupin domain-containing protein [Actinomycetota bacterium]